MQPTKSWWDDVGLSLSGSPVGFANPAPKGHAYTVQDPRSKIEGTFSGFRVQLDLTRCLRTFMAGDVGLGSQALDFYVRLENSASSTATIESVTARVFGRTSMMDRDSYANGKSDDVNLPRPSMDSFPQVAPSIDVDLSKQNDHITFRLSPQVKEGVSQYGKMLQNMDSISRLCSLKATQHESDVLARRHPHPARICENRGMAVAPSFHRKWNLLRNSPPTPGSTRRICIRHGPSI